MTWLAVGGWLAAVVLAVLVLDLRRRLELVARAEHELRGPLGALAMASERVRRGGTGSELAGLIEAQLDRSRAGLADLSNARRRRKPMDVKGRRVALHGFVRHAAAGWRPVAANAGRNVRFDWRAGRAEVAADRGRLAQALGNLLSNAIEHGAGEVEVRGRRVGGRVRIEVADSDCSRALAATGAVASSSPSSGAPGAERGRGLRIAGSAVEAVGGRLTIDSGAAGTTAVVDLPLIEQEQDPADGAGSR